MDLFKHLIFCCKLHKVKVASLVEWILTFCWAQRSFGKMGYIIMFLRMM